MVGVILSLYDLLGKYLSRAISPITGPVLARSKRAYLIIEHSDNGELLVAKNWFGSQKWRLPGGGVHRNEDEAIGLAREVREELSLALDPLVLDRIGVIPKEILGYEAIIYKATLEGVSSIKLRRLEIIDWQWLKPENVQKDNSDDLLINALDML